MTILSTGSRRRVKAPVECECGGISGTSSDEYIPQRKRSTSLPSMLLMTFCPPGWWLITLVASYTYPLYITYGCFNPWIYAKLPTSWMVLSLAIFVLMSITVDSSFQLKNLRYAQTKRKNTSHATRAANTDLLVVNQLNKMLILNNTMIKQAKIIWNFLITFLRDFEKTESLANLVNIPLETSSIMNPNIAQPMIAWRQYTSSSFWLCINPKGMRYQSIKKQVMKRMQKPMAMWRKAADQLCFRRANITVMFSRISHATDCPTQ